MINKLLQFFFTEFSNVIIQSYISGSAFFFFFFCSTINDANSNVKI